MAQAPRYYAGIDVGTGSARAGLFDATGRLLGAGSSPLQTWRPRDEFVEQSSDDVWRACGAAMRGALEAAGVEAAAVRGLGFDATCSLVVLDADDRPVTVDPDGDDARNVIVWMDHRAVQQSERINATRHEVLRYVGGTISPEMQTPKLLWLKENLAATWRRAGRFLDLPDFLAYRATGSDVRSLCTTVCKWTYLGHAAPGWQDDFFWQIGLGDLTADGFERIGTEVRPMGERAGLLTDRAAADLGLAPRTPVAVAIIDAHAGGLGTIGAAIDGVAPDAAAFDARLALIGGTSSCHMAVSREPRFIRGVWGPYFSAMVPDLWLNEGGQSATGALIDHVIDSHARGAELRQQAKAAGRTAYDLLNEHLAELARGLPHPALLTRELHVLPYHHGNRSPRADPTLRGMVSGLRLGDGVDALALLYLATVQAIAYGTRHILEAMNAKGYRIDTILACGGGSKNPVFLREHADATQCRIVLPREPEAVLLGAAILGAVAAGDQPDVVSAMAAMSAAGQVIAPAAGDTRRYHDAKYAVFQRMHADHLAYRQLVS